MPSKLYCCKLDKYFESEEEQKKFMKEKERKRVKLIYWKKNFKYKINDEDFEDFSKISKFAKKLYDIHDFLLTYKPNSYKPKNREELEFYTKNKKIIDKAEPHLNYIKTLQRI